MTGFLHLNAADAWPAFDLGTDIISDAGVLTLAPAAGAFVRSGALVGGPFTIGADPVPWFKLRLLGEDLRADEHLEIYTLTSDSAPTPVTLTDPMPFADPRWHRSPRDLHEVLIPGAPVHPTDALFPGAAARQLWIGVVLRGSGRTSPRIHQMRVDYGRQTTIGSLPAIYGHEAESRERLERLLALHEGPLRDLDAQIADAPRLFDPAAAPAGAHPACCRGWRRGWTSI